MVSISLCSYAHSSISSCFKEVCHIHLQGVEIAGKVTCPLLPLGTGELHLWTITVWQRRSDIVIR